jgi:hypothetical protein
MLDRDSWATILEHDAELRSCKIELPESWRFLFSEQKDLPVNLDDRRQFARYRLRVVAALRYLNNLPHPIRPDGWFEIFAKDISQGGFSFLHSEQMYPQEQVELAIGEQYRYVGVVRRCRRVNHKCYVVGARFCEASEITCKD